MKNGINFDEAKQKKIREQFLLLCQKHHISTKCPSIISYDTLEDEIRKRILNQVQKEIQNIHRPYIWKIKIIFDQVHVFYKTDEQCEACLTNWYISRNQSKNLRHSQAIGFISCFS